MSSIAKAVAASKNSSILPKWERRSRICSAGDEDAAQTENQSDGDEDSLLGEVMVDMTTYVAEAVTQPWALTESAFMSSTAQPSDAFCTSKRGRTMSGASYKKLDFVDYFKALTQTQEKWIEEFVGDQKRLAILEAFVTDRVTLGRALDFLLSEFPKLRLAWAMEQCLRQSARRYFLPKEDLATSRWRRHQEGLCRTIIGCLCERRQKRFLVLGGSRRRDLLQCAKVEDFAVPSDA